MSSESNIQMIPIKSICIVNPRERGRKKFNQIIGSIEDIGLKRPITVCPREDGQYDLICGQGRLESFERLGQTMVPAIIRDVSSEDLLLMSLVENIARRNPGTMGTVRELADLRSRGYNHTEIGKKTGMGANYVGELLYLYDRGEEHLLNAVDAGKISLSSAIIISRSEYKDVQSALLKSLEEKKITIKELQRARVLADMRKAFGKSQSESKSTKLPKVTSDTIIRTFRREQQRQQQAIRKSDLCEKRLSFASSAFRKLFKDENFINLLRAEGLDSIPEYLAAQIGKDNQ